MAESPSAEVPGTSRDLDSRLFRSNISRSDSAKKFSHLISDEETKLGLWKKYLADTPEADNLARSDNLFDLIEQSVVDEDCQKIIDELDFPEENELSILSTLRYIITIYSKSENKRYRIGNGWVPLLGRLVLMNQSKLPTYVAFKSIRDSYVPEAGTHGFVLRLLLLYHDPELCNLLDTDKMSLAKPTESWVNTLFAGICTESVRQLLWTFLFKSNDPYRIFFVILSIIIINRGKIMEMKFDATEKIFNTIKLFPRFINTKEIQNIIKSAETYDANTPPFFKELFKSFMFGEARDKKPDSLPEYLPTSAHHVVENINTVPSYTSFYYFIVDCRPHKLYDAGRFATKRNFHMDCGLITDWSSAYLTAAKKTLLSMIEEFQIDESESEEVKHICLMGSGLQENDKCVEAVVRTLIKSNTKYVSILHGGYDTAHKFLIFKKEINYFLINHDEKKCVFCNPALLYTKPTESDKDEVDLQPETFRSKLPETEPKFTDKVRQRLRQTGQGIRKQLLECVNSSDSTCENTSKGLGHEMSTMTNLDENIYEEIKSMSSNRSLGTSSDIYGVFDLSNITKSDTSSKRDNLQLEPVFKPTLIDDWLSLPNIEKVFKCKEVLANKRTYGCRLIVTDQNLILLRRHDQKSKNKALLILNCSILNILKITTSARDKSFITIHFDKTGGNMLIPYEKMRLLMPEIKEFINLINKKFNLIK